MQLRPYELTLVAKKIEAYDDFRLATVAGDPGRSAGACSNGAAKQLVA